MFETEFSTKSHKEAAHTDTRNGDVRKKTDAGKVAEKQSSTTEEWSQESRKRQKAQPINDQHRKKGYTLISEIKGRKQEEVNEIPETRNERVRASFTMYFL